MRQRLIGVFHVKQEFLDYEGSDYKQRFWTSDRRYEDIVERQALRAMLPPNGEAIADLGAGFGRLADLYAGYRQVFLVDYSRSLLQQARQKNGDERFTYVAADIRRLPLASNAFDSIVTIRVLHHIRDIRPALAEAARVLVADGNYLLEYANKRHLKAIARYMLRRQQWSPFAPEPVEFAELNFDFHPAYMSENLQQANLRIEERRALSLFRWQPLKNRFGAQRLAKMEAAMQPLASLIPLSPSVIVRASSKKEAVSRPGFLLACPMCHQTLEVNSYRAICPACRLYWPKQEGIYDFKGEGQPLR